MSSKRQHIDKIQKLIRNKRLTPNGAKWLVQNLDPFHDTELTCVGYPDLDGSKSLTICEVLQTTITNPSNVTSGTWDCHIFSLPDARTAPMLTYYNPVANSPMTVASTAGAFGVGFVNVVSGPTGSQLIATSGTTGVNNTAQTSQFATLNVPDTWLVGNSRVVGYGIEITDSSAEMNLQGMVNVYRQPQSLTLTTPLYNASSGNVSYPPVLTYQSRLPPLTLNEVLNLPGVKPWKAKDGAYLIGVQNNVSNPFSTVLIAGRKYSTMTGSQSETGFMQSLLASYVDSGTPPTYTQMAQCKPIPFDTAGAYFSGLAIGNTLTISVRVILERTPTSDETTLAQLAHNSPGYDPIAFQIYARAVSRLPCGVPVGENPLGEWFDKVLDAIADYSPLAGHMFGPTGSLVGKAVSTAAKAVKGVVRKEEKKIHNQQKQITALKKKVNKKK